MFGFFPQKAGKRRTLEHQKSNTATARTGWLILLEAAIGIEPMNKGFAGLIYSIASQYFDVFYAVFFGLSLIIHFTRN